MANRHELLIDDDGMAWPAEPATVVRHCCPLRGQRSSLAQAIALGFILVGFHAAGVRIALRPQFVTRKSISRLAVLIAGSRPTRVALCCDPAMSAWELIFGAGAAISRIDALVAAAHHPQPRPLLHQTRLPVDLCDEIDQGRLLPLLRLWEDRARRWAPEIPVRLQELGLLQHAVLSRRPASSERVLVEHLGERNSIFGPTWARIARGHDVQDLPNRDVGCWRAATVRQTLDDGEARLSTEDCVFRRHDGDLVRERYARLALPWYAPDGGATLAAIHVRRQVVILERRSPAN